MGEVAASAKPTMMEKALDPIELIGNKVPNPVIVFAYLIVGIWIISTLLDWAGVGITEEIAVPVVDPAEVTYYLDTPAYYVDGDVDFEIVET